MPVRLGDVRRHALSFPDTTEEPHHTFGSFRVRGKIFLTVPPGDEVLHVFLPDEQRDLALALDPGFLEPLTWGSKVMGVRVHLAKARRSTVLALVSQAYAYKSGQAEGARRRAPAARSRRRNHAPE